MNIKPHELSQLSWRGWSMWPIPRWQLTVSNTSWKAQRSEFNFILSIIYKKFSCFSYPLWCTKREKLIQYVKIMDVFWDFTLCSVLGSFLHFKGHTEFGSGGCWSDSGGGSQKYIRRLREFRSVSNGSRRRDDCTKRVVQTMTVTVMFNLTHHNPAVSFLWFMLCYHKHLKLCGISSRTSE